MTQFPTLYENINMASWLGRAYKSHPYSPNNPIQDAQLNHHLLHLVSFEALTLKKHLTGLVIQSLLNFFEYLEFLKPTGKGDI
jgi:hypothetical protein